METLIFLNGAYWASKSGKNGIHGEVELKIIDRMTLKWYVCTRKRPQGLPSIESESAKLNEHKLRE